MDKSFSESIKFNGRVDKQSNIIHRVELITSLSKNNRIYTPKALESIKTLSNGVKAFMDHEMTFGRQSVKDLLGEFKNTHQENQTVYGDLYLNTTQGGTFGALLFFFESLLIALKIFIK